MYFLLWKRHKLLKWTLICKKKIQIKTQRYLFPGTVLGLKFQWGFWRVHNEQSNGKYTSDWVAPRPELKKKKKKCTIDTGPFCRWGRPIALICCESGGMGWLELTQRGSNCKIMGWFFVSFFLLRTWEENPSWAVKTSPIACRSRSLSFFLAIFIYLYFRWGFEQKTRREWGENKKKKNILSD